MRKLLHLSWFVQEGRRNAAAGVQRVDSSSTAARVIFARHAFCIAGDPERELSDSDRHISGNDSQLGLGFETEI